MRIVTIGNGPSDWAVFADWLGDERIVFQGSVFACCRFVGGNV